MNLTRWAFTQDSNSPPWSMDARHIDMIAAVVRLSGIKTAVEIGCLHGRSTTAFVEAVEQGAPLQWLGLCDANPKPSLYDVAAQLTKTTVEILTAPSSSITWQADLWVIDGDHDYASVKADYELAVKNGAKIIVLHDTSHHRFDGPGRVLDEVIDTAPGVFDDDHKRPGEETERGIAFLFTDKETAFNCTPELYRLSK